MKKGLLAALAILLAALTTGCSAMFKKEKIVGKDIPADQITEFVYTYENINYDAVFLRYRFTVEDKKSLFSYEKRERPGDYGPATEKDVVAKSERALTPEEWEQVLSLLSGGAVVKREESAESGSSGPWTYLYWRGDRGEYQQYAFASFDARTAFEGFCATLAES